VAKKKRTKSKTKRISFKRGISKRKRTQRLPHHPSLIGILKVLAVICILGGAGIGFVFLDEYVKKAVPVSEEAVSLELVGAPLWVNEQLKEKIYTAATAHGEDLKLDEDVVRSVQENLAAEVAWLNEVKVRATHERLRIEAEWRKPLALVKRGLSKFYVDNELVVLDFVPILSLPIVNVKGLSITTKAPPVGEVWQKDDLAAAVAILDWLDCMDEHETPDKPLLYEIDSIDVSNFEGRQNGQAPHIILYAKDNTEIIWGAELGNWQRYLEATDEEKIAKLYEYYKAYGSLSGDVKYINLLEPQDDVPLPVDRY